MSTSALPETDRQPWATPPEAVARALDVDPAQGLTGDEAARRLAEHGPNEVAQEERTSLWTLAVRQFMSPIVGVLIAAGVLAGLAGEVVEAIAVVIAVVVNAVIGFVTELRAMQSVESLRELGRSTARVRRDGAMKEVDGADLVPGDVVLLEEGDVVGADLRLRESSGLMIDEAPLTGESAPQEKSPDPVDDDTVLAERTGMAFKGTRVTVGSGEGIVVGTGADTQIGEVATMVEEADDGGETPLERQLDRLGRALLVAVAVVGVVVAAAGILVGQPVQRMVETAIALAIAAVPEGLPLVATLALARGVVRMSRRNALVKRLSAVETLGSAGVVFTDKTGTLTTGDMEVEVVETATGRHRPAESDDEGARAAVVVGALCGNAELDADGGTGDPMELALQRAAVAADLGDRAALLRRAPERREVAFDRDTKMMATIHEVTEDLPGLAEAGRHLVAVKGAPGAVVEACTTGPDGEALDEAGRREWIERQAELAGDGLRVLALAARSTQDVDDDPYHDLRLLGMVGLLDPPREATAQAIADCHTAGIDVVMVTGDQPATAAAIAAQVGLVEADDQPEVVRGRDLPPAEEWDEAMRDRLARTRVFARLDPRQKLDLIDLAQSRGQVVGMTGDGVNDAPALKKADIGIAMGEKGTQVARDAADIVLQDDAFETIVSAVREGRTIFENIRRFVVYLLSGNLGEIIAVTLAAVGGFLLPLLPLQILYINLVGDVFPASALGVVPGDEEVLRRSPRDPGQPILDRTRWQATVAWAVLIAAVTLAAFAYALGPAGLSDEEAVTTAFLTFVIARLVHVFNMRAPGEGVLDNPVVRSPAVWGALAISGGLAVAAVAFPPLAGVLQLVPPTGPILPIALIGGLSVLLVGQLALEVARRRGAKA